MLVAEKAVGLSWASVRDRLPFLVISVLFSAVVRNPVTLAERLVVGFMESGRFKIVRSGIAMSVRG